MVERLRIQMGDHPIGHGMRRILVMLLDDLDDAQVVEDDVLTQLTHLLAHVREGGQVAVTGERLTKGCHLLVEGGDDLTVEAVDLHQLTGQRQHELLSESSGVHSVVIQWGEKGWAEEGGEGEGVDREESGEEWTRHSDVWEVEGGMLMDREVEVVEDVEAPEVKVPELGDWVEEGEGTEREEAANCFDSSSWAAGWERGRGRRVRVDRLGEDEEEEREGEVLAMDGLWVGVVTWEGKER